MAFFQWRALVRMSRGQRALLRSVGEVRTRSILNCAFRTWRTGMQNNTAAHRHRVNTTCLHPPPLSRTWLWSPAFQLFMHLLLTFLTAYFYQNDNYSEINYISFTTATPHWPQCFIIVQSQPSCGYRDTQQAYVVRLSSLELPSQNGSESHSDNGYCSHPSLFYCYYCCADT